MSESKRIGELMLQGWTLSAETCPRCGCLPLVVQKRSGASLCVRCDDSSPAKVGPGRKDHPILEGSPVKDRLGSLLSEKLGYLIQAMHDCPHDELIDLIEAADKLLDLKQKFNASEL